MVIFRGSLFLFKGPLEKLDLSSEWEGVEAVKHKVDRGAIAVVQCILIAAWYL